VINDLLTSTCHGVARGQLVGQSRPLGRPGNYDGHAIVWDSEPMLVIKPLEDASGRVAAPLEPPTKEADARCPVCGAVFIRFTAQRLYCSRTCSTRAAGRRKLGPEAFALLERLKAELQVARPIIDHGEAA